MKRILLVGLCSLMIGSCSQESPEKTARAFVNAINAKDFKTACTLMSHGARGKLSEDLEKLRKSSTGRQVLAKLCKVDESKVDTLTVDDLCVGNFAGDPDSSPTAISGVDQSGDTAKAYWKKGTHEGVANLVKEEGRWVVSGD